MSYYTDKFFEIPTKMITEIAGLACRNANNFHGKLARIRHFLDSDVLLEACEVFIVPLMTDKRESETALNERM